METKTDFAATVRPPALPHRVSRRPRATTIVAALYVALVLGAPGIVRFAPEQDGPWLTAVTTGRPYIRCAAVAAAPSPCEGFTMASAGNATSVR